MSPSPPPQIFHLINKNDPRRDANVSLEQKCPHYTGLTQKPVLTETLPHTQTCCEVLAVLQELGSTVDQPSPAHAQCGLPVQPAGLIDNSGQRQTQVSHAGVLLSMLSQDVAQLLSEGQPESRESVKKEKQGK